MIFDWAQLKHKASNMDDRFILTGDASSPGLMLDKPSQYMHYCVVLLCEVYCVIV